MQKNFECGFNSKIHKNAIEPFIGFSWGAEEKFLKPITKNSIYILNITGLPCFSNLYFAALKWVHLPNRLCPFDHTFCLITINCIRTSILDFDKKSHINIKIIMKHSDSSQKILHMVTLLKLSHQFIFLFF